MSSKLESWTLVFTDVTNDPKRSAHCIPEQVLDELRALDFSRLGVAEGLLLGGDPTRGVVSEVMVSPTHDALIGVATQRDTGHWDAGLTTTLDDGTVVATDTNNNAETWRKYGAAIRNANLDGYDLVFAPPGTGLPELVELHRDRVHDRARVRGAKPVVHESMSQYLDLRHAVAVLRAERILYQRRFAGWMVLTWYSFWASAIAWLLVVHGLEYRPVVVSIALAVAAVALAGRIEEFANHRLGALLHRRLGRRQRLRLRSARSGPYR